MILVFTRLVDEGAVLNEWPFGNTDVIGFTEDGQTVSADRVKSRIQDIKLMYVHKRLLCDRVFPEFMSALPVDTIAIAHPGGSDRHIKDAISDISAAAPEVNVSGMLKATYSVNRDPDLVGRIVKNGFANSAALTSHLVFLCEYVEEWKRKLENLGVSAIRHKVGEIILPLDIDLQALEMLFYTQKTKVHEYFKDCFPEPDGVARVGIVIKSAYKLVNTNNLLNNNAAIQDLFTKDVVAVGDTLKFDKKKFEKWQGESTDLFVKTYAPGDDKHHINLFHEWFKTVMSAISRAK